MKNVIAVTSLVVLTGCASLDQNRMLTDSGHEITFSQFSPAETMNCQTTFETEYYIVPKPKGSLIGFKSDIEAMMDQYLDMGNRFAQIAPDKGANYVKVDTIEKFSPQMNIVKNEEQGLFSSGVTYKLNIETTPRFMKATYYACDNLKV